MLRSAEFASFARGSDITTPEQKLGIHRNTRTVGDASGFQTQQKGHFITVHNLAWLVTNSKWVPRAGWLMQLAFMMGGECEGSLRNPGILRVAFPMVGDVTVSQGRYQFHPMKVCRKTEQCRKFQRTKRSHCVDGT